MSRLLAAMAGVVMAVAPATTAMAAPKTVTLVQQLSVVSEWTQEDAASFELWNEARLHQDEWADYAFDWSTDNCSAVPDAPFGFDFTMPCRRHDFGYRNYKRLGVFDEELRLGVDRAFHADMKRVCEQHSNASASLCSTVAYLYYLGVREFGDSDIQLPPDARTALERQGL